MGDDKQDSADGMRNGRWQWALCQPAEFRTSGFGGSARRQASPMHVRCVAVGATLALAFSADELCPTPAPGFFAHPVGLPDLPLPRPEPVGVAAGREPGVLPAFSGAAVPVHR